MSDSDNEANKKIRKECNVSLNMEQEVDTSGENIFQMT